MRTTLAAGVVALTAGTLAAAPADAGDQTVVCRLNAVNSDPGRVAPWVGSASGWIAHSAGASVSIRCVVKVNGAVRAATAWGSGTTTAATSDTLTWGSTLTESMQFCAQFVVSAHSSGEMCFRVTVMDAGPFWVISM